MNDNDEVKYLSRYKCTTCKNEFEQITIGFIPEKEPPCPYCPKEKKTRIKTKGCVTNKTHNVDKEKNVQEIIATRKAPATGPSVKSQIFDNTMEMVMQDYGMTNIKDNAREGENSVTPLESRLEKQVESVFSAKTPGIGDAAAAKMQSALMSRINQGAFRNYGDVVASQSSVQPFTPASTNIVASYDNRGAKPA